MAARIGSTTPYYSLSDGASLPSFATDKQRRSMQKKDEALRRRIELLQDFGFPGSSQCLSFSKDGQYIVAAGGYPPACRVYELGQLGLKYERRLSCECVDLVPLTDDLGKMVFLLADRTLDFHAPYGTHYKTRVPSHGRSLAYDASRCELLVAATKGQVYRMDLDQGKFLEPFNDNDDEVGHNRVALCAGSAGLPLVAAAGDDGVVRFWDARCDSRKPCARVQTDEESATSLAFDTDGLTLCVGGHSGSVKLFDVRSSQAYMTKEHQYELPILDVHFHARGRADRHATAKLVISADAKLVKAWDTRTGQVKANVEPSASITRLTVAPATDGDSGLILCTGDQPRVMAYYVPALGPAPKWCAFVDSMTEELEETSRGTAYDDYRFVTARELEDLGASGLMGTPMLRAYMHGFFVDARLFKRLKAVAAPQGAYEDWRKEKIEKKLNDKAASRIRLAKPKDLPKVNSRLANRLLEEREVGDEEDVELDDSGDEMGSEQKKKKTKLDAKKRAKRREQDRDQEELADAPVERRPENPLGDDRFAAMFQDTNFQVDETTEDYQLRHPNAPRPQYKKKDPPPAKKPKREVKPAPPQQQQQQNNGQRGYIRHGPNAQDDKQQHGKQQPSHQRVRTTVSSSLGLGGAALIENYEAEKPISKRLKKKHR